MTDLMICSACKVPVPPEGHACPAGGHAIPAPPPPPWLADPSLISGGPRCSICGTHFEDTAALRSHVKGGHK